MNSRNCYLERVPRPCSRRTFLKNVASYGALSCLGGSVFPRIATGATTMVYPPRTPIPNPYVTADGKPLLVVVSGDDFGEMLRTGLERIGGLGKLVDQNQDVLIKPNLNSVDVYPAIASAQSIATLAQEVGRVTTGSVKVGDMGFHSDDRVYEHIGLEDALSGTGAEAVYFSETLKVRRVSQIKRTECKRISSSSKPDISVYTDVYNSPVIISLANMKRHFLAYMSTALKNNVGTIASYNARNSRAYLHELQGSYFLWEVAEIASVIKPELTVVDARSALIGNGPFSNSSGAEILEGVNVLIMSGDMIAVDLYCAMLLEGLDRTFSSRSIKETLKHAQMMGLGVKDLSEVEIIDQPTSVENTNGSSVPYRFQLYQNYPNPFNASTQIGFRTDEENQVILTVYNALGRKMSSLVNQRMSPGEYSFGFDGNGFPSGTYFYQLKVGHHLSTKKMTLIK